MKYNLDKSKMDYLYDDVLYLIIDNLSTYDVTNLRLTCIRLKNTINKYYYINLNLTEYDRDIDYFKEYLLYRTDMHITIALFFEYNQLNSIVLEDMNIVKYLHNLNDNIRKFVDIIIKHHIKKNIDIFTLVDSNIVIYQVDGKNTIIDLIRGSKETNIRTIDKSNYNYIFDNYIRYILYDHQWEGKKYYLDLDGNWLVDREYRLVVVTRGG